MLPCAEQFLVTRMHIARFFIGSALMSMEDFLLPPEAAHHATRVLRLSVGDEIELFDGSGLQYPGRIQKIEGGRCWVTVGSAVTPAVESALSIHLGQALLPSDKFDWVLQKSVELGVTEITPLEMRRSIVKIGASREDKKKAHWEGVVRAAAEQCGRVKLPALHQPKRLESWVTGLPQNTRRFVLDPRAKDAPLLEGLEHIAIVIGPEGGFEASEEAFLQTAGFEAIRLGPRVLRAETAALAAITAFQSWCGDFRRTGL